MSSLRQPSRRWLAGAAVIGLAAILLLRLFDEPRPEIASVPAPVTPAPVAAPAFVPTPVPSPPRPVAANTAGVQLKGVLGFHGGAGAAIFELPDGRQRRVAVGSDVVPGARLEAIGADRATIHDGVGRREFVLPELRSEGGPGGPMPSQTAAVAMTASPGGMSGGGPGPKGENDVPRPQGYRLTGAVPPALDGAGLRPGDMILAVNGQPLDRERLPTQAMTEPTITIDFERNGERMSTTVSRDQPASDIRASVR